MLNLISDVLLGGVTGLIGTAVSAWVGYKTQKLKGEQELARLKAEREMVLAEADANVKITKAQVDGAVELVDADAYQTSIEVGNKALFGETMLDRLLEVEGNARYFTLPVAVLIAGAFGFVDFLRGIMRPGLTLYLCGATTWITWMAWKIMQQAGAQLSTAQAVAIFGSVTSTVTYLTVSCVTWWFGDRQLNKAFTRKLDAKGA